MAGLRIPKEKGITINGTEISSHEKYILNDVVVDEVDEVQFIGVTYQQVQLAEGKRLQITVPSATSTTCVFYDANGAEQTLTEVSAIKFPYEFGYNGFPSSKVLELLMPTQDYTHTTNSTDYYAKTGTWLYDTSPWSGAALQPQANTGLLGTAATSNTLLNSTVSYTRMDETCYLYYSAHPQGVYVDIYLENDTEQFYVTRICPAN